jgi:sterol desaturase/sphingolipid hydroxylase (fatty acid hydroxylase superfamily)
MPAASATPALFGQGGCRYHCLYQGHVWRAGACMIELLGDGLGLVWGWIAGRLSAALVSPWSRNGLLAIAAGFVIGGFAFRHYHGAGRFSPRAYLRHAFPRRVYWSGSFAVDVQIFLFERLLAPLRWIALVVSVSAVAAGLAQGLEQLLGPVRDTPVPGLSGTAALAIALLLAMDFGTYVTHRLSHQLPVLWAFHRVHHSAEHLNPLTLNRKHPVYMLLSMLVDCVTVAPLQALVLYGFGAGTNVAVLGLTNLGFVAFAYCAASLRHTHIWLSYGPVLDRIVVSPALHQIHHSRAPRHFDRNYGEVLAVWDWLFGTLYQPQEREELEFGLGDEDEQPHPTLAAAMLEPFAYAWQMIRRPAPGGTEPALSDRQH